MPPMQVTISPCSAEKAGGPADLKRAGSHYALAAFKRSKQFYE